MLRTDNTVVYASELYRKLVKPYGLQQEFILPHTSEQNGVAESFMGTFKLEVFGDIASRRTPQPKSSSPRGSVTSTRPDRIHAWATCAGGVERTAEPQNKRIICPESVASLQRRRRGDRSGRDCERDRR